MNRQEFNKAIENVKKIGPTAEEKRVMLARILAGSAKPAGARPTQSVKSPWSAFSFSSWVKQNRWSYVVAVVLIVSLGSSSVAFAAQGSLPGDALYPVKINVIEPLQTSVAFSPAAKATLAADFAVERMQEGEALANQGKLDQANQTELSNLITIHTQALNADLTAIASSDPQEVSAISSDFQSRMNDYAGRLKMLAASSTPSSTSTATSTNQQHYQGTQQYDQGSNTLASSSNPIFIDHSHFGNTVNENQASSTNETSGQNGKNYQGQNNQSSYSPSNQGNDHPIMNLAASAQASADQISSWQDHGQSDQGNDDNGSNNNNNGNSGPSTGATYSSGNTSNQNQPSRQFDTRHQ